jgi:transcriptional regulator with XRE-family HTH domain
MQRIGERIKRKREQIGLQLNELAKKALYLKSKKQKPFPPSSL